MIACPNINHPDWIELEAHFGKEGALLLYERNNQKIPTAEELKKLLSKEGERFLSALESGEVPGPDMGEMWADEEAFEKFKKEQEAKELGPEEQRGLLPTEDEARKSILGMPGISKKLFKGDVYVKKDEHGSNNLGLARQSVSKFNAESLDIKLRVKENKILSYKADREVYEVVVEKFAPEEESMADFTAKIDILEKSLPFIDHIIPDTSLTSIATLDQKTRTIRVHPDFLTKDTIGHEYGHILIDLIGGMSNPLVKRGREQLRGHLIERQVIEKYPELVEAKDERIEKEILTMAVGKEMTIMFDDEAKMSKWERWLVRFFRRIKQVLGLESSAVKILATRLMAERPLQEATKATVEDRVLGFTIEGKPSEEEQQLKDLNKDLENLTQAEVQLEKIEEEKAEKEIAGKAIIALERKLGIYARRGTLVRAQLLEKILKGIREVSPTRAMLNFTKYATAQTADMWNQFMWLKRMEQKGKEKPFTIQLLMQWKDYLTAFDSLENYRDVLQTHVKLGITKEGRTLFTRYILPALNDTITKKRALQSLFMDKSQELLVDYFEPLVTRIEGEFRESAEREWNVLSKREKETRSLEEYKAEVLETNKQTIKQKTRALIDKELKKAGSDINLMVRYVDNMLDTNDVISAAIVKAVVIAERKARRDAISFKKDMLDVLRPLEKMLGTDAFKSSEKFYDFLIELDDKGIPTQHLVGPFHSKLIADYKLFSAALEDPDSKKHVKSDRKRIQLQRDWKEKHAPRKRREYRRAEIEFYKELVDKGILTKKEGVDLRNNLETGDWRLQRDIIDILKQNEKGATKIITWKREHSWDWRKPIKEYINPQWEELERIRAKDPKDPRIVFYDFIIKGLDQTQEFLPFRYRLHSRLPGMTKDLMDRLRAGVPLLKAMKETRQKELTKRPEDIEKGAISQEGRVELVTEANEPAYFLPAFYTNEVEAKDQLYDIATLYFNYFMMAVDYAAKSEVLPEIEAAQFHVKNREVTKRDVKGNVIKDALDKLKKRELTKSGETSLIAAQLGDWMKSVVYGQRTADEGDWNIFGMEVDVAKASDLLNKYTALNLLGLNMVQGVANVILGESLQIADAVGGEYFDVKMLSKASAFYTRNMPGILGDIGLRAPTNIVNLLNEQFDTLNEYIGGKFQKGSRFRELMHSSTLFFTSHAGEHLMQTRTLIAMLMGLKAKDKHGKHIMNKNNKPASMLEMYSVENKRLVLDLRVANFGETETSLFGEKVKRILSRLHGEYSDLGRVAIQRFALGRMGYMFRKFVVPGYKRRWHKKRYNEFLEDWTEGNYITTGKFFKNLYNELRATHWALSSMPDVWRKMTRMEKANIRKMLSEVAFLGSTLILGSVFLRLRGEEDDDFGNWFYTFMSYQALRLRAELLFFTPKLDEAFTILRSPMAAQNSLELTIRWFGQLTDPLVSSPMFSFDRYERGPWKGQPKIWRTTVYMTPGIKQIFRVKDIGDQLAWFR